MTKPVQHTPEIPETLRSLLIFLERAISDDLVVTAQLINEDGGIIEEWNQPPSDVREVLAALKSASPSTVSIPVVSKPDEFKPHGEK